MGDRVARKIENMLLKHRAGRSNTERNLKETHCTGIVYVVYAVCAFILQFILMPLSYWNEKKYFFSSMFRTQIITVRSLGIIVIVKNSNCEITKFRNQRII